MTSSPSTRGRALSVAAVLSLTAAACSSGVPTADADPVADAEPISDSDYSLAFDDASAGTAVGPNSDGDDDDEEVEVDQRSQDHLFRVLDALQAPDSRSTPVETTSTTQVDETAPPSGGAPSSGASSPISGSTATTIGGGGGGDLAIYTGVLGELGRDDVVVAARAPAPTVAAGHQPLTGLPGEVPNRPAVIVKVDNGRPARPQTGLNAADIVVEEEVEGGVTRFAAVFHSTSTGVGPVRSARTTDIGIINGFGSPLLLYSGANAVTDTLIRRQPTVQNRSAATSSGYWRSSARRAPSNLYSDTASHWASANGGPPPAQFSYRNNGDPVGGVDDTSLTVAYRASHAGWSWDGSQWLRSQGGAAHLTASGAQISAANVVVIEAREVATGMVDSTGATVPEFVFVGEGKATVFTAGKRIDGIWTRPTLASAATLTTEDGAVIELTPGRTWIELIRAGAGMLR